MTDNRIQRFNTQTRSDTAIRELDSKRRANIYVAVAGK